MNPKAAYRRADRIARGWGQHEGSTAASALDYASRGYRPDYHEGIKRPYRGALPSLDTVRMAFRLQLAHCDRLEFSRTMLAQARALGRTPEPDVIRPSWYRLGQRAPAGLIEAAHARGLARRPPLP